MAHPESFSSSGKKAETAPEVVAALADDLETLYTQNEKFQAEVAKVSGGAVFSKEDFQRIASFVTKAMELDGKPLTMEEFNSWEFDNEEMDMFVTAFSKRAETRGAAAATGVMTDSERNVIGTGMSAAEMRKTAEEERDLGNA